MNAATVADTWPTMTIEQKKGAVRGFVKLGFSPRQMADQLHTTRGAILGFCFRQRIAIPARGNVRVSPTAHVRAAFHGQTRQSTRIRREPDVPAETWHSHREPVGMLDLTEHTCRWPVGEAGGTAQMFCGDHVHARGYCAKHAGMAGGGWGREVLPVEDRPYKESINRHDYRQFVHGVKAPHHEVEE